MPKGLMPAWAALSISPRFCQKCRVLGWSGLVLWHCVTAAGWPIRHPPPPLIGNGHAHSLKTQSVAGFYRVRLRPHVDSSSQHTHVESTSKTTSTRKNVHTDSGRATHAMGVAYVLVLASSTSTSTQKSSCMHTAAMTIRQVTVLAQLSPHTLLLTSCHFQWHHTHSNHLLRGYAVQCMCASAAWLCRHTTGVAASCHDENVLMYACMSTRWRDGTTAVRLAHHRAQHPTSSEA